MLIFLLTVQLEVHKHGVITIFESFSKSVKEQITGLSISVIKHTLHFDN